MIRGEVTPERDAVISIRVRNESGLEVRVQAIVDTGFSDYISLPPDIVDALELPWRHEVPMILAGNVRLPLDAYSGWVEWDGDWREVEVIKAEGDALVGMGQLHGYRLTIDDVDGGPVTISAL